MMDVLAFAERYDSIAGFAAVIVLVWHLWKCERRSSQVWERLNDLSKDVHRLVGKIEKD